MHSFECKHNSLCLLFFLLILSEMSGRLGVMAMPARASFSPASPRSCLLLAYHRMRIIGIPRSCRRLTRCTPTPLPADSPPFIGSWQRLCLWSRSNLWGIFAYLFIGEVAHHLVQPKVSAVPPKSSGGGRPRAFEGNHQITYQIQNQDIQLLVFSE